jgi:antitoxin MazE
MQTVVKKWGNSLALRIPQSLAADLRLTEGATVWLSVEDEKLIVKPTRKRFRLADLLADMSEEKKHKEIDWGKPKGEEVW